MLLDLLCLDATLGYIDSQQAALEPGLQLPDLDVVGQGKRASPGSDLALREKNRGFGVVTKLSLDCLARRRSFDWTAIGGIGLEI